MSRALTPSVLALLRVFRVPVYGTACARVLSARIRQSYRDRPVETLDLHYNLVVGIDYFGGIFIRLLSLDDYSRPWEGLRHYMKLIGKIRWKFNRSRPSRTEFRA
jgi:hypothetical protein